MTADFQDKSGRELNSGETAQHPTQSGTENSAAPRANAHTDDKIDALTFLKRARSYIRKAHEFAAK